MPQRVAPNPYQSPLPLSMHLWFCFVLWKKRLKKQSLCLCRWSNRNTNIERIIQRVSMKKSEVLYRFLIINLYTCFFMYFYYYLKIWIKFKKLTWVVRLLTASFVLGVPLPRSPTPSSSVCFVHAMHVNISHLLYRSTPAQTQHFQINHHCI